VKIRRVEAYLLNKIEEEGAVHMTLLDPERTPPKDAAVVAGEAKNAGTSAIMVGGSTVRRTEEVDSVVKAVKKSVDIPVIIFPNDVSAVSRFADAIWFMSLLNSTDPYFITGAQALASGLVKEFGVEPIPLGYIVVGSGGTVGVVGRARPLSYDEPELIASYALAARYLGMRFVYLEAGSGAERPVPPDIINKVKKAIEIPLIVGGGIRSSKDAFDSVNAGADMIVTGTVVERSKSVEDTIRSVIRGMKEGIAWRSKP
jgi:phosphoglycerol geranylgeranyltransferase